MKLYAFWVQDILINGAFETPRAVTPVTVPNGSSGTISQEYYYNFGWFICGAFKASSTSFTKCSAILSTKHSS